MLKATLFGMGQARYFDRELCGFPGHQACLLFCYLILNKDRPHHREQLAAIFWPDHASDAARKNLRNTLWRLRQMLQASGAPPDDYLFTSEETISFMPTSSYWLDVDVFTSQTERCQMLPIELLQSEDVALLAAAVDLYTGDLLENVYEDWCLYERERLRLLYLDSLDTLLQYHASHGAYQNAILYGERILLQDNTREKVHRQLMWLQWLAGNRSAALLQYQRCTRVLHDELNAAPLEQTRQLYEKLRTGAVTTQAAWPEPAPQHAASDMEQRLTPLLNQTRQRLHQLQQMVEETRAELRQMEHALDEAALRS